MTTANQVLSGSIKLFEVGTWREIRELTNTGAALNIGMRGLSASPLTFSDGEAPTMVVVPPEPTIFRVMPAFGLAVVPL